MKDGGKMGFDGNSPVISARFEVGHDIQYASLSVPGQRLRWPAVGFEDNAWALFNGVSGSSKGQFLKWLSRSMHERGWLVEDDVFFSGAWSELPHAMSHASTTASTTAFVHCPHRGVCLTECA